MATGTLGPVLRSHWLAGPGVLARYWSAGHVTGAACTVDWGEGRPGGHFYRFHNNPDSLVIFYH